MGAQRRPEVGSAKKRRRSGTSDGSSSKRSNYEPPKWCGFPKKKLEFLWLEVLKGPARIGRFDLNQLPCNVIGRDERCELTLKHLSLSRQHAAFVHHSGEGVGVFLIDLGSRHGTFVGDKRIEAKKPVRIAAGMKIRFGASTRVFILRDFDPTKQAIKGVLPVPPTSPLSPREVVVTTTMASETAPGSDAAAPASTPKSSLKKNRTHDSADDDVHPDGDKPEEANSKAKEKRSVGFQLEPETSQEKTQGIEEAKESGVAEDADTGPKEQPIKLDEEVVKKRRKIMILKQKAAQRARRSLISKSRSLVSQYGALPTTVDPEDRKSHLLERMNAKRAKLKEEAAQSFDGVDNT